MARVSTCCMLDCAKGGYRMAEEEKDQPSVENEEPEASEESVEAEQAGAEQTEEAPGEEETPQSVDVYGIAKWVIGIMTGAAWQYMGLQTNPATGKVEKDMVQAKVAVDTVVFLSDLISPHLEESERRELRSLVNDLQVNFVQHRD